MTAIIITQEKFEALEAQISEIRAALKVKFNEQGKQLLDNEEFIKKLKISRRTSQTWRDQGLISYSQIGSKIFYTQEDIEEFLKRHQIKRFNK